MTVAQHTPGPWIYRSKGRRYEVVHDFQRGGIGEAIAQHVERAEDARAISAVPELLEALELAAKELDVAACDQENHFEKAFAKAATKVRAAIAKAKGQST